MTTSPRTIRPPITAAQKAAVVAEYRAGHTPMEIATRLDLHHTTVSTTLRAANIKRRAYQRQRQDEPEFTWREARVMDSLRNGSTLQTAAKLAGLTLDAAKVVKARAKRIGWL